MRRPTYLEVPTDGKSEIVFRHFYVIQNEFQGPLAFWKFAGPNFDVDGKQCCSLERKSKGRFFTFC